MIQGDPQRAACLSAQIDELLFHVGTREAFRRAIVLQNELNALRPPPRAPDPDAPLTTTYDWLSKRSFRSHVRIAIRQDKDGLYRSDTNLLRKGGVALLNLATPMAMRRPLGRENRRSTACSILWRPSKARAPTKPTNCGRCGRRSSASAFRSLGGQPHQRASSTLRASPSRRKMQDAALLFRQRA